MQLKDESFIKAMKQKIDSYDRLIEEALHAEMARYASSRFYEPLL